MPAENGLPISQLTQCLINAATDKPHSVCLRFRKTHPNTGCKALNSASHFWVQKTSDFGSVYSKRSESEYKGNASGHTNRPKNLNSSVQRTGSISLVGLTFRPCASFTMLSRLTFRSPRSIPPT